MQTVKKLFAKPIIYVTITPISTVWGTETAHTEQKGGN